MNQYYDVIVVGGGPAGLAAAISAGKAGATVLLCEREAKLGGILKQCIHDGFGLVRFNQKLTGPEYATKFLVELSQTTVEAATLTFVSKITKSPNGFTITAVSREGVHKICSNAVILATGCRERTAKQVAIHGTRPAGVFTAGTAQHYTNIMGQLPTKRCVILGSGDIGLIMARRLTLEGAKVVGVFEAKATPSGLSRNIAQCLNDFNIPLHTSKTVTRVFGDERLDSVEVCEVDSAMQPIKGTEEIIQCDALILSVGLIPENELAESLDIILDQRTKGAVCDQSSMTGVCGVFACGNALHVNDLVDYVSESGECAGSNAAKFCNQKPSYAKIDASNELLYAVPQNLDITKPVNKVALFFRSRKVMTKSELIVIVDKKEMLRKKYSSLRPPEMERIEIDFSNENLTESSIIELKLLEVNDNA